jgi:hypothetical protein
MSTGHFIPQELSPTVMASKEALIFTDLVTYKVTRDPVTGEPNGLLVNV